MNPMIAVGFDSSLLTLLLFVIIAGVSSWLKKKQQPEDSDSRSEPPASAPPTPKRGSPAQPSSAPSRPLSWEEELRRLLQGKPETPPPVIVRQEPAPPARSRPSPPRPTPPRVPTAPRPGRLVREKMPTHLTEVAKLEETQEKARELERKMHHRLSPAQVSRPQAVEVRGAKATAERSAAQAMLRDRHSIRSAVMVSTILGPPRALDDRPAYSG